MWPPEPDFMPLWQIVDVIVVKLKIEGIKIDRIDITVGMVLKEPQPVTHQPHIDALQRVAPANQLYFVTPRSCLMAYHFAVDGSA